MSFSARVDALTVAIANLIKGRQPLSTVLTDLASRTIGAGSSTSILDRAAGDTRYQRDTAIPIVIDGGGVTITTGTKFAFSVPFACTIVGYDLFGDQTGSIVIDLKKATYSGYPTTTSITASAKPTLSTARKATNTTLTGWTTSIAAGDVIEVVVDSITALLIATLVLKVRKT